MLKNYMTTAFRSLLRNRLNTLIIVFSLGTGIACSILAFLFIHNELSFDRFHRNVKNIHEVKMILSLPVGRAVSVPRARAALDIAGQFPEVVRSVRMEKMRLIVHREGKAFEEQILAAEPAFFEMFTFPLESGSPAAALQQPDSVVLSTAAARKYFGDQNPLGQTLEVRLGGEFSDLIVTGVLEKIPDTSSLEFDVLVNLEKVHGDSLNDIQEGPPLSCFVQLDGRSDPQALQEKFKTTIDVPIQERYTKESGHALLALSSFHLRGEFGSYVLTRKSTVDYSLILAGIAVLVMLVACFNFVNLSVGKASTRITEIGVRKVLGAQRKHLVRQFWAESLAYGIVALAAGVMLAEILMPAFNRISQKSLSVNVLSNEWTLVFFAGLVLLVGIIAGSYPALVLSKFSSVDLFRGKMKLSGKNAFSRSLVVLQFGVSIFLIVATAFLFKQKDYMLNTSLGYNPDQVVVVPLETLAEESRKNSSFGSILKDRLLAYEMIQGASLSSSKLAEGWMATYLEKPGEEPTLVVYNYTDQDFIPTMGLQLIVGRNFSHEFPSDCDDSVIINRSFARMLGLDDPTGHRLSEFFQSDFDRQIIGVVEDFHYESLHAPIYPAMMGMEGMNYEHLFVKIDGARIREAIDAMEREFTSLIPQAPFLYSFLDEEVARQYERERHWTRLVEFASVLAILIACSGLVGLSLQTIGRRTREIGIRKVLGASVPNILSLINREFVWLVLAANVLAWPMAYFAVSAVLKNYAYRITMGPTVFLGSGLLAFLVAVLTISVNALKAARTNPSRTLKYE